MSSTTIRRLTYADYAALADDQSRHEIIDGEHVVTPSPIVNHQAVLKAIFLALVEAVEKTGRGQVLFSPVDVELSKHDIVVPDLVVILNENRIVTPTKIKGAPDHVVEVLSPSTASRDRGAKRELYERAGVREYWIVDADEHEVTQLVLRDGKYQEITHAGKLTLQYLPSQSGVIIELSRIW